MGVAEQELQLLREQIDLASLEQRQDEKETQSQWTQTRLMLDPNIAATFDNLARKQDTQKRENLLLQKQLGDIKKLHGSLRNDVSLCRAQVADLRTQIG